MQSPDGSPLTLYMDSILGISLGSPSDSLDGLHYIREQNLFAVLNGLKVVHLRSFGLIPSCQRVYMGMYHGNFELLERKMFTHDVLEWAPRLTCPLRFHIHWSRIGPLDPLT